jgi:hypothetical protein
MKVILISGLKRSGKDFSASLLREKLESIGKPAAITAFADPLKEIAAKTLGMSIHEFNEHKNNYDQLTVDGMDYRTFIQRLGTEAIRGVFGDKVWANSMVNRIKDLEQQGYEYVIIPDFRFYVEFQVLSTFFNTNDLKILRIEDKNQTPDEHSSESELEGFMFDYVIDNTQKNPQVLSDYLDSFMEIHLGLNID